MKKYILILVSIYLYMIPSLNAQNASASIAHYNEFPGEVIIPIEVSGFVDITSITMFIDYDSTALVFVEDFNHAIPMITGVSVSPNPGYYRYAISWQGGGMPHTFEGTLVELKFNYLGGSTVLEFDVLQNEVSDVGFNTINVAYYDGSVSPPVQVSIAELNEQLPGSLQVPLYVDFSVVNAGVEEFEFVIEYDEDVFDITGISNQAMPDITFEVLPGNTFSINWMNSGSNFNGKLLDLDFDYAGGVSEIIFLTEQCFVKNSSGDFVNTNYADGSISQIVVSLELSNISAQPDQINLCQNSLITVQLKDVNGNNIYGSAGTVTLQTTLGNLSAVTDNLNGTYTAILTPETPYETGLAIISGKLDGNDFENAAIVEFLAAPELFCPDDVVVSNDPGQCGAEISFTASVSGYPASILTYHIGETTIDSPQFFPAGTTFVLVKATFECGVLTCIFSVTVADSEPPVVAENGFSTVACLNQAVEPVVPDANDNCDGIIQGELFNITDNPDPILCEGLRVFTFSFTDEASNISYWTYTYTIEYEDFTMPDDNGETIACASDLYEPTPPQVFDNCGTLLIPDGPYISETPACEGEVTYTWTYTDCANHSHDWVYTFTMLPTTGPGLVNIEIDCESLNSTDLEWSLAQAEAFDASTLEESVAALFVDNCGGTVTAELTDTTPGAGNSDQSWAFNYHFTITDVCNISTSCMVTYSGGLESEIPWLLDLPETFVNEGDDLCLGAENTIVVQQGLYVSGGSITLIAAEKISFMPNVVVQAGGMLHAYISDNLCENPAPMVADKSDELFMDESSTITQDDYSFKIFPNPGTGVFYIELNSTYSSELIRIEVFNLLGERIFAAEWFGTSRFDFDLGHYTSGVYIVRINDGKQTINHKLIKQ